MVLRVATDETILAAVQPLDLELLARFHFVLAPDLGRQDDPALRGDTSPHPREMASYLGVGQRGKWRMIPLGRNPPRPEGNNERRGQLAEEPCLEA